MEAQQPVCPERTTDEPPARRCTALYDALCSAGASEEKARAAARVLADYGRELAEIRSTQRLHTWVLAVHTGLLLAVLWRVFTL
jgi:hypothetical protein